MIKKSELLLWSVTFVAFEAALFFFVDRPLSGIMAALDDSHKPLIDFFRAYTDLGKSTWYLWPSGIALIIGAALLHLSDLSAARRARIARLCHRLFFFFASIAVSGLLTDAVKPLIGRARPVEWGRDHAYGFQTLTFHAAWNSMPSGHATTAAALTATLMILAPRGHYLWLFIGLAIAASRVMVNAHYLSDVLAGIGVGLLTTLLIARQRDINGMFPFMKGIFPIDKTSTSL